VLPSGESLEIPQPKTEQAHEDDGQMTLEDYMREVKE